jgi:hypothetical protein
MPENPGKVSVIKSMMDRNAEEPWKSVHHQGDDGQK